MSPTPRWPIHPAPAEGEALSSWVTRLAHRYEQQPRSFLARHLDFSCDSLDVLDTLPPEELLVRLQERTRVTVERQRQMTLPALKFWDVPAQRRQVKAILLPDSIPIDTHTVAHPWLPRKLLTRACPMCLDEAQDSVMQLIWRLPLVSSCAIHTCVLDLFGAHGGWQQQHARQDRRTLFAGQAVKDGDARTLGALAGEEVHLLGGDVNPRVWMEFFRRLLDELIAPATLAQLPRYSRRELGLLDRDALIAKKTAEQRRFENLAARQQIRLLSAAAIAVFAIERGQISVSGSHSVLVPLRKAKLPNPIPGPVMYMTHGKLVVLPPGQERPKRRVSRVGAPDTQLVD